MISNLRVPFAALAVAALLCSGCAFRRHVAGMAVEHNDFVAQATNRQTVLNILRASEREPMHFTTLSRVNGKVQGFGQIGVNAALNGDGGTLTRTDTTLTRTGPGDVLTHVDDTDAVADALTRGATNWTPSAQVSVTTGTDFEIGVNATQEFYRGILGPLSPGIIIHYLRQGFPPDMLSHLVIGRLEFYARVTPPGGTPQMILLKRIRNTPDESTPAEEFAAAMRCRQLAYQLSTTPASSLPVPLSSLSGISADVLARIAQVRAADGTVSYQLVTPARTEFKLTFASPEPADCSGIEEILARELRAWAGPARPPQAAPPPEAAVQLRYGLEPEAGPLPASSTAAAMSAEPAISEGVTGSGGLTFSDSGYFDNLLPPGYQSELIIDVTIRSVEGILFYLGEYIRRPTISPKLRYRICRTDPYCLPIVRVLPASQVAASDRFITVSYRGQSYAVPLAGDELTEESGRSSQAISLVQQLLNLHRSATELPYTPLVRVLN